MILIDNLSYNKSPFRKNKTPLSEMESFTHFRVTPQQGWAENSIPSIYRWNLPVFPGMANKSQVANNGKYNFFAAKYWQI